MPKITLIKMPDKKWVKIDRPSTTKYKVRFFDVTKLSPSNKLTTTGDSRPLLFDMDDTISWSAESKKQFTCIKDAIRKYEKQNALYRIYAWADESGYDYWKKEFKDGDRNYIQISVEFKHKKFPSVALEQLDDDLKEAYNNFENIENDCSD